MSESDLGVVVKPKVHVARTAVTCVAVAASAYVELVYICSAHGDGAHLSRPVSPQVAYSASHSTRPSLLIISSSISPSSPRSLSRRSASHPPHAPCSRLFRPSGMSGQYLLAPLCGEWIDRFGPWSTSLSASAAFASGWGWFAYELSRTTYIGPEHPAWPFRRLVAAFFLCGLATASSYVPSPLE